VFTFQPDFTQAGDIFVTFLAIDSEDPAVIDSQIVQITVLDFNRAPEFEPIGPFTMNEGDTLNFTVVSSDPDGTIPQLILLAPPLNSTFVDNGDGTGDFTFMPSFFQAGLDSARFMAIDQIDPDMFAIMSVNIEVLDVNRPPVITTISDTTIGDGFMLSFPIEYSDPDSTQPLLFYRNLPASATITDFGDGFALFEWRPSYNDIGIYFITIGCFDEIDPALADSQIVTIEVLTSGNHPPIFNPVPDQMVRSLDTLNLLVEAFDPDGDSIVIDYISALPEGMVFTDSGNGTASLYWIPTFDQAGFYTVTLEASDDSLLSDIIDVNIEVRSFVRGDANGDGTVNGLDVVYLLNYFKGYGPAPDPIEAADANGDGSTNGLDVVYLVAYLKGGPPPPPSPPNGGGGGDIDIIEILNLKSR
jgi:hypothetical protein